LSSSPLGVTCQEWTLASKWIRKRVRLSSPFGGGLLRVAWTLAFAWRWPAECWHLASKWLWKKALIVHICHGGGLHRVGTWHRSGLGREHCLCIFALEVACIAWALGIEVASDEGTVCAHVPWRWPALSGHLASKWLRGGHCLSFALEVACIEWPLGSAVASERALRVHICHAGGLHRVGIWH